MQLKLKRIREIQQGWNSVKKKNILIKTEINGIKFTVLSVNKRSLFNMVKMSKMFS